MRYIILAQSPCTEKALGAWLELLGWKEQDEVVLCRLVPNLSQLSEQAGVLSYRQVAGKIAAALVPNEGTPSGDFVTVLADSVHLGRLSVVGDSGSWNNMLAMLILTFPEVRWLFGVIAEAGEARFRGSEHWLPALFLPHRDPLLDPTGLREWVRNQTNKELVAQSQGKRRPGASLPPPQGLPMQLPVRRDTNLAAVIDDEVDFAVMHGYAAYRYGFRADIITSWALMEDRFVKARSESTGSHGYALLIEDMRLTFGDKKNDTHLSELAARSDGNGKPTERAGHCPLLDVERDDSQWRFVITTGQMGSDQELVERNEDYLARKARSGKGRGALHFKPMGGLCDLWEKTGMREDLTWAGSDRGNAPAFFWPPPEAFSELYHGHGAPGKLAVVAAFMVERAEILRDHAISASDFIRASVVAGDAAEILSGKTPALTLAALALKHECEVRAECTFMGAGFHFGLKRRLEELKAEVASVAWWFHAGKQETARLDAESALIHRLRLVFQEVGQWEEEHECLVAFCRLNRKLQSPWWKSRWYQRWNPAGWGAHWLLAYGEWLLGSFAKLLTSSAVILAGITCLVRLDAQQGGNSWHKSMSAVVGWVFGGNASGVPGVGSNVIWIHVLSWFAVAFGIFHFGLLISYLYSLISRK